MARKRVTLAVIAETAGVSVPTVARILAGGNKETWPSAAERAERVRRIAHELGYRPDHSARSLASRRADCIALAFGADQPLYGGVYAPVLAHLIRELGAHGYDLLPVAVTGPESRWSSKLIDSRVDGMLVMQPLTPSMPELIGHYAIPSVLLNLRHPELAVPQVLFDDAGGMAQALAHLAELGHRRVAYHPGTAPEDGHYHVAERQAGFLAACTVHGIAGRVLTAGNAAAVLAQRGDATAVVCRTDHQAVELLRACHHAGIAVPGALGVVGCNDEAQADSAIPRLTSIHVPVRAMVEEGLRLLLEAIDTGAPQRHHELRLAERLVVRESTGPAGG